MVLWQPYLNKYNIIGFVSYYQLLMVCVSRPRYFDNPTMKERKSMPKTKMVRNVDDGSWLQCAFLMLELHSYWFKSTKTHFSVYGESQNGTNREGRNKTGGIPRSRWSIHGYNLTKSGLLEGEPLTVLGSQQSGPYFLRPCCPIARHVLQRDSNCRMRM